MELLKERYLTVLNIHLDSHDLIQNEHINILFLVTFLNLLHLGERN